MADATQELSVTFDPSAPVLNWDGTPLSELPQVVPESGLRLPPWASGFTEGGQYVIALAGFRSEDLVKLSLAGGVGQKILAAAKAGRKYRARSVPAGVIREALEYACKQNRLSGLVLAQIGPRFGVGKVPPEEDTGEMVGD